MKKNIFKNMFFNIYCVVLLFLVIFSPVIPYFYNGTFFAFIVGLPYFVFNKKTKIIFLSLLKKKIILYFILAPLVIVVFSVFISIFHSTLDFTINKTLINQSLTVIILLFVLSILLSNINEIKQIHYLIWIAFIVQAINILLALVSEDYKNFIKIFQPDTFRNMDNYYGGVRTLSISSSGFFGLGCTYGLLFILYVKYLIENKIKNIFSVVFYLIFVFSILFIARTGFIGLLFSVLVMFFSSINFFISFIIKSQISIIVLLVFFYLILDNTVIENFNTNVIPFAFEMFLNDSNGLETTSSNALSVMFKNKISLNEFFIGTGNYTNENGTYFRDTDIGYLRVLLFGGFIYLLLFIIHHVIIIFNLINFSDRFLKRKSFLFYLILVFSLILNVKGEVIGFLIPFLTLLYLYFLPYLFFFKK